VSERPQYGEFATPEEQSAASGIPVTLPAPVAGTAVPIAPPAGASTLPGVAPAPRPWDRILTVAMLAYGGYSVVSLFFSIDSVGQVLQEQLTTIGFDGFTLFDEISRVALIGAFIQLAFLAVAIVASLRSLRAGRVTFWIPLTAGVVSSVIVGVLFMSVILSDPAYLTWVESRQ
jgi:hypothetical protein